MFNSYYNIDGILAEEELIPCTNLFEFSHLSDLDSEGNLHHCQNQQKQLSDDDNNGISATDTLLPESSRIKVPLWAVDRWAMLGFVRLQLPRHYKRSARERYDADPGNADLRKRNERFFLSGRRLINLIEQSSTAVAKAIAKLPRRNSSNSMLRHTQALKELSEEARSLRRTILQIYGGERLRKNFDLSQCSSSAGNDGDGGGDYNDNSEKYFSRLTEMEKRLYNTGSSAVSDIEEWRVFGNRSLWMASSSAANKRTQSYRTGLFEPTSQRRKLQ